MKSEKKIWINKTSSFRSAEKFEEKYYLNMTSSQRLEIMQFLREIYSKFNKGGRNESRKRLRRSIKIIQQT